MNKKLLLLISLMSSAIAQVTQAEDYPFSLPATVNATININSSVQESYNNKLLGTNIHGFSSREEQDLIKHYNPMTVRFPHGLWANWYDWRTDGTRVFGTDTFQYIHADGKLRTKELDFLANIKIFENSNIKVGIEGLTLLNTQKKDSTGNGYDMLWTFNMSADGSNFNNGSPETMARYKDLIGRGFEVKDIELGNENFYPGQRSSIIPNAKEYILRAKSMSAALKAKDASIRVSVPLLRRTSVVNPSWNADLTKDLSYFDAVTVHTYVGSDPDDANSPAGAYSTALTARHHLAASVNDYAKKVAPNKPIWLSEWGVKSGGPNAVSVLGMADAYIFMSENQKTYDRANWFSVNGKLNSFLVWEDYTSPSGVVRQRIKYPLIKTAYGSTYEIIRSVFQDSTLLASSMTSPDLMQGVESVSARAVVKEGKTIIFVVNLTNKAVPFTVKLDGSTYSGYFNHSAMAFNSMAQEKTLPINANPLTTIQENGIGQITLPKYSINTILLKDTDLQNFSVDMTSPNNNSVYVLGNTIDLSASVNTRYNDIKQVNFRVDGAFVKADFTAPYTAEWTPSSAGTYSIDSIAIKQDDTRLTSEVRTVTIIPAASSASSSSASSSGSCASYINVAFDTRTEVALTAGACLRFSQNLNGKTLQVWDSDSNSSCDYRGTATAVGGSGSLNINSNYVSGTGFTGRDIKLTNAAGNSCKFVKVRAY